MAVVVPARRYWGHSDQERLELPVNSKLVSPLVRAMFETDIDGFNAAHPR